MSDAATIRRRNYTPPNFNTELFQPLATITSKEPTTHNINLVLSYADLAPDGYKRKVWAVNGQYPGPLIYINKGDRVLINVTNNLEDPTTIHWHGILQTGTNWYDGVGGHSHYLAQYVDGIRGPFIINDPDDPYLSSYDYEYVLTVEDWYHSPTSDLVAMRLAPGYEGYNPVPDAGLISGRGQYNCSKALEGSTCDPNNMPAIYTVKKGKRYRFRIINMSAEAFYWFSIDQHMLQVIEVDGVSTKASNISVLPIHIGQRYSVIIEASQEVGNYWIRAEIPDDCIMNSPDTINHDSALYDKMTITGILQYEGAPSDALPDSKKVHDEWSKNLFPCRDLDVDLLKPYAEVEPPKKITNQINISVTIHADEHQTTKAYINNQSWVPDITNPSIMKIMSESISATQFPINANAYMYDTEGGAKWCRPSIPLGISSAEKMPTLSKYNLIDPPLRDTLTVPANGWAVIRYIINNPGVWAFHCHIEWHVELGMVFQLIEQQDKMQQNKLPDAVAALCAPGYQNDKYDSPHTKRLTLSSPEDDDYVTITGGGYKIHHKNQKKSSVKRNTKKSLLFTKRLA
ncbi:33753_t:CDS:10, partial [Racocetra persica]